MIKEVQQYKAALTRAERIVTKANADLEQLCRDGVKWLGERGHSDSLYLGRISSNEVDMLYEYKDGKVYCAIGRVGRPIEAAEIGLESLPFKTFSREQLLELAKAIEKIRLEYRIC